PATLPDGLLLLRTEFGVVSSESRPICSNLSHHNAHGRRCARRAVKSQESLISGSINLYNFILHICRSGVQRHCCAAFYLFLRRELQ
ncbi:hypothetical protein PFISCL1PPCAC_12394, partial [Pristionchus fissidentatus]